MGNFWLWCLVAVLALKFCFLISGFIDPAYYYRQKKEMQLKHVSYCEKTLSKFRVDKDQIGRHRFIVFIYLVITALILNTLLSVLQVI